MATYRAPQPWWRRMRGWFAVGIISLLAVVIGGSWLLIVYFLDGRGLLNEIKVNLQTGRAGQMQSVTSVLARSASLSEHVEILAVYATPEFFEMANRQTKGIPYDPATSFIFIVNEDTHMGSLGLDPTPVMLRIDGERMVMPEQLELLGYSDHHKVSVATFPRIDAAGVPLVGNSGTLELIAGNQEMAGGEEMAGAGEHDMSGQTTVSWSLPITYPEGALEAESVPFSTLIAVSLGLLATVMTPCLIQLLVIYLTTLTGMTATELETSGTVPRAAQRRLMQIAFGFVLGYALLFTSAGALAGFAGERMQSSWGAWTRPLSMGAGVVMVLLGVWMAVRARAPLVCRLPLLRTKAVQETAAKGSLLQSTLIGLTFAVGCSTCFGGALIATLLLYVGTLGSAWQGAAILFFFSLGVGIPFIIAAALITRAMPLVRRMHRFAPAIGLVSSLIVVAFGTLLITNQFHLVSTWMAPLLGLS